MNRMKNKSNSKGPIWVFAAITMIGALVISAFAVQVLMNTKTYWVLGQDVEARTQITSDMLVPKEVTADGVPDTAIPKDIIEKTPLYAKADLKKGEPVTTSTAGSLTPINKNIPETFTIASISLDPIRANLGIIKSGDLIDIYYTTDDDQHTSRLIMRNVLVVNAASSVDTAGVKQSNAKDGDDAKQVATPNTVYQVALSPQNVANLSSLTAQSSNLYVVPSPIKATNGAIESNININSADAPIDASVGLDKK